MDRKKIHRKEEAILEKRNCRKKKIDEKKIVQGCETQNTSRH